MHPAERLQRPSRTLFDRMQEAARSDIRLATIALEPNAVLSGGSEWSEQVEMALDLIRYLSGHGGVVRSGIWTLSQARRWPLWKQAPYALRTRPMLRVRSDFVSLVFSDPFSTMTSSSPI
jgi:hypothetical protein